MRNTREKLVEYARRGSMKSICYKLQRASEKDVANHQCLDHFTVDVGDGEEGYNAIVSAFKECKLGSFARAIMLNPLHPNLPRLAILCMPTCNKFDTTFVYRQWQEVQRVYEHVIGPLVGNSSDGDSRRRKIMLQLAGSNAAGNRFQPIPTNLGFVFSCLKEEKEDGFYNIRDLCDQDYIHNHKKLLNPLDHATRVLMLGDYMVHMNHSVCTRSFLQQSMALGPVTSTVVIARIGDLYISSLFQRLETRGGWQRGLGRVSMIAPVKKYGRVELSTGLIENKDGGSLWRTIVCEGS
ncbi:hypothetical protein ACROYT_G042201 [Oculina patagonica]